MSKNTLTRTARGLSLRALTLIGILTAVYLATVPNFVSHAEQSSPAPTINAVPVTAPTPPVSLISGRCSAYSAPVVPAPLRTIYVNAAAGSDSNDGLSPANAWRTLTKANNSVRPGDLFLVRGTFTDQWISPADSGTSSNKITFRREPGFSAILDGGLYDGAIDLIGRSHIVVDGFEIVNTEQSIRVAYESHHNWFRNLYIHNASGTAVKFRFGAQFNRLEDSVITNVGTSTDNDSDAINLLENADNNVIVRNYVGYASHAAYNDDVQGESTGANQNNIVAQNIFDNPWASNVILAGRSSSTIVECNIMRNATQDSQVNYPRMGIQLDGDDNIIRYNYIYNNKAQGILIEGRVFASSQQMFAENNHIYHNTIVGNGTAGIMFVVQGSTAYVRNNLIENNLLWNNGGYDGANGSFYDVVADHYSGNNPWVPGFSDGNVFRDNNVSSDPSVRFLIAISSAGGSNHVFNSPESVATAFPLWTGNTSLNPLFSDQQSGDFSLKTGSPMIDSGRHIPGVVYTGSAPDRGAFEFDTDSNAPAGGLEGDVATGHTGDGLLRPDDVETVRQFAVGTKVQSSLHNEFQRADSAPRATKGDGLITAADVVQAKRFVAGMDSPKSAGGPTGP